MDTTSIIITTIISLITIISFVGTFITNQTKLSVQLAHIQEQISELKTMLTTSNDKYQALENRVLILEQKRGDK